MKLLWNKKDAGPESKVHVDSTWRESNNGKLTTLTHGRVV